MGSRFLRQYIWLLPSIRYKPILQNQKKIPNLYYRVYYFHPVGHGIKRRSELGDRLLNNFPTNFRKRNIRLRNSITRTNQFVQQKFQVRCVSVLTLPTAFGRTGRGVLRTFALTYILAGPLANLVTNSYEVVRVFGCTSQLTYNLTKTRYGILVGPYQTALAGMRHDEQLIFDTIESIHDVVEPLVEEVESQAEADRLKAETDYVDDLEVEENRFYRSAK